MHTITISDRHQSDQGFEATVSFDYESEYPITVVNPVSEDVESLAEHAKQQTDLSQAKKGGLGSRKDYGEQLFNQIFHSSEAAYAQYRQLRDRFSQLEISIESQSLEFQAIHWEALRDPELEEPLATQCTLVRRLGSPESLYDGMEASPYLDLLLVTARPGNDPNADPRTMARPIVEAIERAQLPVRVELLRPATYEALENHLQGKEGYYHIVHFDAQGTLLTCTQLQAMSGGGAPAADQDSASESSPIPKYEDRKAFLLLEGGGRGTATLVDVDRLALLLREKSVPLCLLNDCQPLTNFSQDSIASHLMVAGVRTVVAMGDLAEAGTTFLEHLYAQLLAGQLPHDAVYKARRSLYERQRHSPVQQLVNTEDWLLPAVYCSEDVDLNLRELTPQEAAFFEAQKQPSSEAPEADAPVPEAPSPRALNPKALGQSLLGRDLDILKVERALDRHNILLLLGEAGVGKTALLHHLRWWWPTIRFAEKLFYFDCDERPQTVEQIVSDLSQELYNPLELKEFQALPLPKQIDRLGELLRANRYLLMLDGLTALTAHSPEISAVLASHQRQALKYCLQVLAGGLTKVLLTSRSPAPWLEAELSPPGDGASGITRHVLRRLVPDARLPLARSILGAQRDEKAIAALSQDPGFEPLIALLSGSPLAMKVVLPQLRQQTPREVLAELQAQPESLPDRADASLTEKIIECAAYFHAHPSPKAQLLLLGLAPFKGGFRQDFLPEYFQQLKQHNLFQDYSFEQFEAAIAEAISKGLLSRLAEDQPQMLAIQPVLSYFLGAKLRTLGPQTQWGLRQAFKTHYRKTSGHYRSLINSTAGHERRIGLACCRLEYENLSQALKICLEEQDSIDIFYALRDFLRITHDLKGGVALSQFVYDKLTQYPETVKVGKLGLDTAMVAGDLATCHLLSKNYPSAEELYWEAITLAEALTGIEEKSRQLKLLAVSFHQLGIVEQKQKRWEQAKGHFTQSLTIKAKYEDTYGQACTYHQLGVVAQQQWQWQQAIEYFDQALTIKIESGDFPGQANTYYQLGVVAQEQRQWQQAIAYFNQALAIKIKYGDRFGQARMYDRLGTIAQEQRQWQQATEDYTLALSIYGESGDRAGQARTYHNLGVVSQERRQWQQATRHYEQALELYIEQSDRPSQARTHYNLGAVLREQRQWQQATVHCHQALDRYVEQGDRAGQAQTYFQLGLLTQEQQRWSPAKDSYGKALAIYTEFGDRYSQARVYSQLGHLAEACGDWPMAAEHYLEDLRITMEFQDEAGRQVSTQNVARVYREYREEGFLARATEILEQHAEELG